MFVVKEGDNVKKFLDLEADNKIQLKFGSLKSCPGIEEEVICNGSSEFYSKIFGMEKWWFPASNVGGKEGPLIFIGETDGEPSLLLFTNSLKAAGFAKKNKIETNENGEFVIARNTFSVISSIGDYIKLGISRVIINLSWQIDIEEFRKLYLERVKKYNFKQLVRGASIVGNKIGIGELWTAIFNVKAWYFIADLENGIVYGTKMKTDNAIFVYLNYSEATKSLRSLNLEANTFYYKIYKYTPTAGYEFLLFMRKEAFVDGVILRDEDVYSGAKINTIERVREIFNIS